MNRLRASSLLSVVLGIALMFPNWGSAQSLEVLGWNFGTSSYTAGATSQQTAVSTAAPTFTATSVSGFSVTQRGNTTSRYPQLGSWNSAETSMLSGRSSYNSVSGAKVFRSTFTLGAQANGDWSNLALRFDYQRTAAASPTRVRAYLTWQDGSTWKTTYSALTTLASSTGSWQTLSLALNTGAALPTATQLAGEQFLLELQFSNVSNSTNNLFVDNLSLMANSLNEGWTMTPAALPEWPVNKAYHAQFAIADYPGSITWSRSGTLPTGLTLNTSTGVLSGTPTATGSFSFTLTATGTGLNTSASYTLVIAAAPVTPPSSTTLARWTFDADGTAQNDVNAPETIASFIPELTWGFDTNAALTASIHAGGANASSNQPINTALGGRARAWSGWDTADNYATTRNGLLHFYNSTSATTTFDVFPSTNTASLPPTSRTTTGENLALQFKVKFNGVTQGDLRAFYFDALRWQRDAMTVEGSKGPRYAELYAYWYNDSNVLQRWESGPLEVDAIYYPEYRGANQFKRFWFNLNNGSTGLNERIKTTATDYKNRQIFFDLYFRYDSAADLTGVTGAPVILVDEMGMLGDLTAPCPVISVCPTQSTLTTATQSSSYSTTFIAAGSTTGGYVFSRASGTLPPGLTLNGTTGVLSGTPSTSGSFSFVIRATDGDGCFGERTYQLLVAPVNAKISVTGSTNNVPITRVELSRNGSAVVQTTEAAAGNVTVTNDTLNLSQVTINDGGVSKTLNAVNIGGSFVRNNNLSASTVGVGVTNGGVQTSITGNGMTAFVNALIASTANSNLNHYIYYDGVSNMPAAGVADFDVLFNFGFEPRDFIVVSERFGNSYFELVPLDANGNVIAGARTLRFESPSEAEYGYDWNSGFASTYNSSQSYCFTVASVSLFGTTTPIFGFRINNDGEADVKFFGMSDDSFSNNPTAVAGIGDRVWNDTDKDGVQDSGELGLAGITVNLLNTSNAQIATTTTNSTGNYNFFSLAPGTYRVEFVSPTGYSFSPKDVAGFTDGVDNDADPITGRSDWLTVYPCEIYNHIDAGLYLDNKDYGDDLAMPPAWSTVDSTLRIGAQVDSDASTLANTTATGDDANGVDDEEGVTLPSTMRAGMEEQVSVRLTNTSGGLAYLNAWMDFNLDGDFDDSGERVISNATVANGTNNVSTIYKILIADAAVVPNGISTRFRLTNVSNPSSTGSAGSGEVEDYLVNVTRPVCNLVGQTMPDFRTLTRQTSTSGIGWIPASRPGTLSQTFVNWMGTGVNATFNYSNNMWDANAPNVYAQNGTAPNDTHCSPAYWGALRFTNNTASTAAGTPGTSNGAARMEIVFSQPVWIDAFRLGNLSKMGSTWEWSRTTAYGTDGAVVPPTSHTAGGQNCAGGATPGVALVMDDGAGGRYAVGVDEESSNHYNDVIYNYSRAAVTRIVIDHWSSTSANNPAAAHASNSTSLAISGFCFVEATPRMGIGNLVFRDSNINGRFDSGEGISGVQVRLFRQGDNISVNSPVAINSTNSNGIYGFAGLKADSYFIHVPASEFGVGKPLNGLFSMAGVSGGDDNSGEDGIDQAAPSVNGISTGLVVVADNAEPTNASGETGAFNTSDDSDDNNTDLTVDLGFTSPMDFGDLADASANTSAGNYRTRYADSGPGHVMNGRLKLGLLIDSEIDGQPNADATGDDTDGSDDDDGVVTMPVFTTGQTSTLPVRVTNTMGVTGYLNGWLDLNNNGSFEDSGEKMTTVSVPTNSNNGTLNLSAVIPSNGVTGVPMGMRLRVSTSSSLTSTGLATAGEVEDYLITLASPADYGDSSILGSASSMLNSNLKIGTNATDAESGSVTNAAASSDDSNGTDDEDGVTFSTLIPGQQATITVRVTNSSGATSYLSGWVDFNNDGSLEASEKVITDTVANGVNGVSRNYTVNVPPSTLAGSVSVRVRLSSVSGAAATGFAGSGEVEDHLATVSSPNRDSGDALTLGEAWSLANNNLRLGTTVDTEAAATLNADATGDDLTGNDDEDAVTTWPSLIAGSSANVSTRVRNASGSVAYLNVWADWNDDGDVLDGGEQLIANRSIANNTNSNLSLSLAIPASAGESSKILRMRLTNSQTPGPTGIVGTGEIEDYLISTLCPNVAITPGSIASGTFGASYSQTLVATGAASPKTWTLETGTLPAGLTLNASTGAISGTPTAAGVFNFTVQAADPYGCAGSASYTLTISSLSLGNLVWDDLDNDGVKDASEPGLAGANVALYTPGADNAIGGTGSNADTLVASQTTTATGLYNFTALSAGTYYLRVTPPSTHPLTGGVPDAADNQQDNDNNGTQPAGGGTDAYSPILTLSGGAESATDGDGDNNTDLTIDFGFWSGLTVGNQLWDDANNNGLRDQTESGVGGALIELFSTGTDNAIGGSGADTDLLVASTTSSAGGGYTLRTYTPGRYYLRITPPVLFPAVTVNSVLADNGVDNDNNGSQPGGEFDFIYSPVFQLAAGLEPGSTGTSNAESTLDFGLKASIKCSVGNLIFLDANNNGRYDAGDSGLSGVKVQLFTSGNTFVAETTTNAVPMMPGWSIQQVASSTNLTNLTQADACLAGTNRTRNYTGTASVVNFFGNGSDFGLYGGGTLMPDGSRDQLALKATGVITIPVTGDYTFAINTDAGGRLKIDGVAIITDNGPHTPTTMLATVNLSVGLHNIEFVGYETTGGEGFEVFASPGVFSSVSSVDTGSFGTFRLVGDTANGGLAVNYSGDVGQIGRYRFNNVVPGSYYVNIPASEFALGASLGGMRSFVQGALPIDDQRDDDSSTGSSDSGLDETRPDLNGLRSHTFTLALGSEPTAANGETGFQSVEDDAADTNADLTIDFAFRTTLTIGNLIWSDADNDGVKDSGEPGVSGALVQLFRPGADNAIGGSGLNADVQVGSDFTTSTSGAYNFGGLEPGFYFVKVTPPASHPLSGGTPDTADNRQDNDNNGTQSGAAGSALFSPVIELTLNGESTADGDTDPNTEMTVDFGLYTGLSLGNLVWNDLDNDGIKDAAEPGVGGVPVSLLTPGSDNAIGGTGGNADTIIATTTTNSSGLYAFNGLPAGRYFVRITPPSTLPLPSLSVDTADNGQDDDNNGSQLGEPGGDITSPVILLTAGVEPGSAGSTSVDATVDFGLIIGNSVLWLIDEDYTLGAALHLWSFDNYRTPSTTSHDYGRLKYRRPSDGVIRDIADAGDIESMAINRYTGEAYILSSSRITNAPSETQSLWFYNLNDAPANSGNIVLTLIGHLRRPTNGAPMECLAYDPDTKRFYTADPKDNDQNGSTSTDRLYYFDIRNLNANPMLATSLTSVGDITGLSNVNRYVDGLEFSTDGKLYSVDGTDDDVYEINPATGAIIAITDNDIAGGAGGSVDVETMAWDEISNGLIAVDNSGLRFIEITRGSNGGNIAIASFVTGVPGMPSTADMEAAAMYDTFPPQPRVGVGNAVFIDANYNGRMDTGEGVNGVKVELYHQDDVVGVDSPTAITTTANGGLFLFSNLLQDSYYLHTPAENFVSGAPLFGHDSVPGVIVGDDGVGEDGIDAVNPALTGISTAIFALTKDAEPTNATTETGFRNTDDDADDNNSDLTIDFGFRNVSMAIGNLVWNDTNNNGVKDTSELGLSGITVTLYTSADNIAGNGDDVLYTGSPNQVTTSAGGAYSFTNLPPGKYSVRLTPPASHPVTSGVPDTADNAQDGDNNGSQPGGPGTVILGPVITLTPNGESITDSDTNANTDLTVDFGLFTGVTVGNLVWNDLDNDGIKDTAEVGVSGVTVELMNPGLDNAIGGSGSGADTVTSTTTTNSSGLYSFTVFTPGRYYLRVTPTAALPANSSVVVTADNAVDNDNNGSQPLGQGTPILSPVIQLTAGGEPGSAGTTNADNTLDFGLRGCPTITITPTALANGTVGSAYTQTVTASGGTAPHSFSISVGSLPAGLSLNATSGVISGVPTSPASTTFTLRVSDNAGCVATRSYTVLPTCPAVTLTPTSLPDGTISLPYTQTLTATGGVAPYTWTLTNGTLPAGLSLNSSTGVLAGTPTATNGSGVSLTFQAVDSRGCIGSRAYTLIIQPQRVAIGNLLWNDGNDNGVRDLAESGINNILVELWSPGADNTIGGTGGNADTKVATTTTAGGGLYSFTGLTPGRYFIKVPTPPFSKVSSVSDPLDNAEDNDNNGFQPAGPGTTAFSPVILLTAGDEPGTGGGSSTDNTVDFGFVSNVGSPFVCDNRFYVMQNAETSSGSGVFDSTLYYIDENRDLVPVFVFTGKKLNALAAYGGYLYCVDQNGNNLYRINSQGVLVDMGVVPGLPSPGNSGQWSGATALTTGRMILNLYTSSPAATTLYTIDLATATLIGSGVVCVNTATGQTYTGNFGDIAWDPLTNKIYGYSTIDSSWLGLFEINATTGQCTRIATNNVPAYGSLVIDANGLAYGYGSTSAGGVQDTLYLFNRTNGVLDGSMTAVGSGPTVANSDGAACPGAPPSMKIGSHLWHDVNDDGIRQGGESGIDGVTLQLFFGGQDPVTATPISTATSANGGEYVFDNLPPGQFFIYIPTPPSTLPLSSNVTDTTDNQEDNDDNGIQSAQGQPVRSPTIALNAGLEPTNDGDTDPSSDLTVDFGFRACSVIALAPASLPAATQGVAYSQTLTASGGRSPYTFAVTSGTLPAGLTLNASSGLISGTPTTTNSTGVSLTFRATDANGCSATSTRSLQVCPVITLSPTTFTTPTVGTSYSQALSATGGDNGVVYSISSGSLPAGLTLNSGSSTISGNPTSTASASFTLRAVNGNGCVGTRSYTVTPQCPTIVVSPGSLPAAVVGEGYSQSLLASGGTAAYTWAVTSGTLPNGLSLNTSSGVVSGTPTTSNGAGTAVTFRATDVYGCQGSITLTLKVCPVISLAPTTLTTPTVGSSYSQTITATGGVASYTFGLASGSLPAGLTLNASGGLSGTATSASATTFVIRATDANGCVGTRSYSLTPVCPSIIVNPTSLPAPTVGVSYSQTLSASGGTAPFSFSLSSGSLPTGLTLGSSSGIVSGIPTSSSSATFTVRITDANGCTGSRSYTLTPVCPTITVTPTAMTMYLSTATSRTLTAANGTAPYTWSLASGSLPPGLSLTTAGVLSGTPTALGVQTFSVRATDANSCQVTQSITVTVKGMSLGSHVWQDNDNDGQREGGEPGVAGAVVQLMQPGSDNAVGGTSTAADTQVGSVIVTDASGAYTFSNIVPGNYYVRVVPPVHFTHTSGTPATADNSVNDNNDGAQPEGPGTALFSPIIALQPGTESVTDGDTDNDTNLTVDFGLWASLSIGNMVFLDINSNGILNANEGIENVLVLLFPQGANVATDEAVNAAITGKKGRYILEGINPGAYFLHIPANQFAEGALLSGTQPISTVVAGDDHTGQDLVFNNSPAIQGASTAVFTLTPGQLPSGSAEAGFESVADDGDLDGNTDLTRDLGVVSVSGGGFPVADSGFAITPTGIQTPAPATFTNWKRQQPGPDDEDLYTPLIEYALGTDSANGRSGAGSFRLETSATLGTAEAWLLRPVSGREDISYTLEGSTDLTTWTRLSLTPLTRITADGRQSLRYPDLETASVFAGQTRGFVRLKITLDADLNGLAEATAYSPVQAFSRETFAAGGTRSFSMPLVTTELFAGLVTSVEGSSLTLPVSLTLPDSPCYVEVLSGHSIGHRFEVDPQTSLANKVVLKSPAPGLTGARIVIRPHWTLGGLLPEDVFTAGSSDADADRILTFDPAANNFRIAWLSSTGWQREGAALAQETLPPHSAVLVHSRAAEISVLFAGQLAENNAPILPITGTRFLGTAQLLPQSPLTAGFNTQSGYRAATRSASASRLRLWKADAEPGVTGYDSLFLLQTSEGTRWIREGDATATDLTETPLLQPFHGFFLVQP